MRAAGGGGVSTWPAMVNSGEEPFFFSDGAFITPPQCDEKDWCESILDKMKVLSLASTQKAFTPYANIITVDRKPGTANNVSYDALYFDFIDPWMF